MNTINDMRNEMGFLYHYNEFEYNQGFEIVLYKDIIVIQKSFQLNSFL